MDNQFLDHGNISSLKYLFRTFSRDAIMTMKQLILSEQDIPRVPPLSTWSVFISLELLDMHKCGLTDFPGAQVAKGVLSLQSVDLSYNRLTDVAGILPLGSLKHLKELNLQGNPMPFIDHRVVLLQKLFYPEKDVHLKAVRIYTGIYRQSMVVNRQAFSFKNRVAQKAPSLSQLVSKKRKPATVPRIGTFPVLELLSGARITQDELESAKPYPDKDIYSSPQHPLPILPVLKSPLTRHTTIRKSIYPCLNRTPRVEPTPRWLHVEPVVLNGTTNWTSKEQALTHADSIQASFIREDDSQQESPSEEDNFESEEHENWTSEDQCLPPLKSLTLNLGSTFSPMPDRTSSRVFHKTTISSRRELTL